MMMYVMVWVRLVVSLMEVLRCRWMVEALIRTIDALVCESMTRFGNGSGEDKGNDGDAVLNRILAT
nr:hypothetical protein [Tanacetum cinerariifolium]